MPRRAASKAPVASNGNPLIAKSEAAMQQALTALKMSPSSKHRPVAINLALIMIAEALRVIEQTRR